jgi:hypothetical protein
MEIIAELISLLPELVFGLLDAQGVGKKQAGKR